MMCPSATCLSFSDESRFGNSDRTVIETVYRSALPISSVHLYHRKAQQIASFSVDDNMSMSIYLILSDSVF